MSGTGNSLTSFIRCNDCNAGYLTYRVPKIGLPHFLKCLWRSFLAKHTSIANQSITHLSTCFSTMFFALTRFCHIASSFFTHLSPKCFKSHLFFCLRGELPTQSRASDGRHIEAWFQCIKPVLLSFKQEWNKCQFQNFKDKSIFTVLIPGALHMPIMMLITLKLTEMVVAPSSQVGRTSNIKLASGNADNAIYARSGGDSRGHANCLSLVALLSCCQGARLHLFAQGNYSYARQLSKYTFFLYRIKAEV